MGNQILIDKLTSDLTLEVDITNKLISKDEVTIIDGLFHALTTYKRHNFQYYKVAKFE